MDFKKVERNKKQYLDLLLLSDEQEDMIDRYIERGTMYILDDNGIKSECVVTDEGDGILEIKNIATVPAYQGMGYGKAMIGFIADKFRGKYNVLQVGTGDVPSTVGFYESCGFSRSHSIKNFFIDNYDHPIYEDGIQLADMVYLKMKINGRSTEPKKLSEMTLEELWRLFPIQLKPHNKEWVLYYDEMKKNIENMLSQYKNMRISHIGSTAIKGIWAKPIIDILVETDENDMDEISHIFLMNDFNLMSKEQNRISFNSGYTPQGFANKVYHVHIRRIGDNNELYFRDYMNEFPETAKKYERLKLELWKKYEFDRDGYTNAKTEFVDKYTTEAKKRYMDRY